jgi:ribonuclease E
MNQAESPPAGAAAAKRATRSRRKATTPPDPAAAAVAPPTGDPAGPDEPEPKPRTRRRPAVAPPTGDPAGPDEPEPKPRTRRRPAAALVAEAPPEPTPAGRDTGPAAPSAVLFMAPQPLVVTEPAGAAGAEPAEATRKRRRSRRAGSEPATAAEGAAGAELASGEPAEPGELDEPSGSGQRSRRRGRRGRGRGKGTPEAGEPLEDAGPARSEPAVSAAGRDDGEAGTGALTRRRRKRRRRGSGGGDPEPAEDGVPTVIRVREPRSAGDEVRGVTGSTRLEAKRQRRRGGRDQRRTRPPVLSESEFLARREAVDRVMVIRQAGARTQIGVLEDGVLVEHYVSRASAGSMVGSVYLGKVQNVLASMEAAFVDVGRGRNAVLYAGEVNWDASGLEGKARSIEQALGSGDSVLVQVTKDPVGHKGARLTSNIALSGRHLVYTPYGNASGISRKLPDTERRRLREVLKNLVPDGAGVIVRTAAESASSEELERDVKRLQSQWDDIRAKAASNRPPALLYSEPDLVVRVVRDLFNEDFRELVIEGEEAFGTVEAYLAHVSPDLVSRLRRHSGTSDVFAAYRIDEQILKGLDRKVFLPSGGHLVIDRTEAMAVIDVNTGKYTGTGGNLEETVTRNNLEAAEEIVRQLRLRDLGGIIVIDFIDMVLESNRDLVLRRLTECLGRDRTKHQVTEITSLGLVQMTRKRVGAGLLEAFSEPCECCKGRGVVVHTEPVEGQPRPNGAAARVKEIASASSGRRRGGRVAAAPAGRTTGPAGRTAGPVAPAAEDDTMGYDLSRYEEVAPWTAAGLPADRAADRSPGAGGPADLDPLPAGLDPDPSRAESGVDPVPGVGAEPAPEPDEPGLSSVFRRFRRRGGRHRP